MKNLRSLLKLLVVLVFLSFLNGCKKEEPEVLPNLTLQVDTYGSSDVRLQGGLSNVHALSEITDRGFVLSNVPDVALEGSNIIKKSFGKVQGQNGSFEITLNDINSEVTYYIKAYCINKFGTYYTAEQSFSLSKAAITKVNYLVLDRGGVMVIEGIGFSSNKAVNIVKLNDVVVPVNAAWSTRLELTIPMQLAGKYELSVTINDQVLVAPDSIYVRTGIWTAKADFPKDLSGTSGFAIGEIGYVIGGMNPNNIMNNELWAFDVNSNTWTRKADFPGTPGWFGTTFTIGSKAYFGFSKSLQNKPINEFWEYDARLDEWTRKADFSGPAITSADGFSIRDKGYIGMGNFGWSTYTAGFWEYNPLTDSWTSLADFPKTPLTPIQTFVIQGTDKAFVCHGNELWQYSVNTNSWLRKADIPGVQRQNPAVFSIGTKGYCGGGEYQRLVSVEMWEYSYTEDKWVSIKGNDVWGNPATFTIGNRAYTVGGSINGGVTNKVWEFENK